MILAKKDPMRKHFVGILVALLTILLVVTLVSCTNRNSDNDDWMNGNVDVDTSPRYARPQKLEGDEGAYQSGERIDLPTIPVD